MRLPREVAAVWLLSAAWLVTVAITYTRLPADELYHVSGSGIEGGLSRALVELNFPLALVALAVLVATADRLPPAARAPAIVAAICCAVVAVPGVVRQADLDARWINVVPAAGVASPSPARSRRAVRLARATSAATGSASRSWPSSSSSPPRGSPPRSASTSTASRCSAGCSRRAAS